MPFNRLKIKLHNLEAPVAMGGIGIKPLDIKAIALRFGHIRNFFVRNGEDWMLEKSPNEAIIYFFLNQAVRSLVPSQDRHKMFPLNIISRYYKPDKIEFIRPMPCLFDVLFWDIERAISVIGYENFEHCSTRAYMDKLVERRSVRLRREEWNSRPLIAKYYFT